MALVSHSARSETPTNCQRIFSFETALSGNSPRAPIIQASDGFLYGTAYQGGTQNGGTVFRISPDGHGFSVLWNFVGGSAPSGGLLEGADGSLYGTTSSGGTNDAGIIFKLNKDGTSFTVLHQLDALRGEGATPISGLVQDSVGKLYGSTFGDGSGNNGVVFKLNPDGTGFAVIHYFTGSEGSHPTSRVYLGGDGVLYGTTENGGSAGLGTAYKLNTDGSGFAVLHHFTGAPADGRTPLGAITQGADGFLYGTTYYGGAADVGALFKLNTNGSSFRLLWSFSREYEPAAGLMIGADGDLYGVTRYGGTNDAGVAFKIQTSGANYRVLHQFGSISGDGREPLGSLIQGDDGSLYGSTYVGGDNNRGTLFKLFSAPPPVLITSIQQQPNGWLLSFVGGMAGQTYEIQASSTLDSWNTVGSRRAAVDGTFQFLDTSPTSSQRFYRSSVSP